MNSNDIIYVIVALIGMGIYFWVFHSVISSALRKENKTLQESLAKVVDKIEEQNNLLKVMLALNLDGRKIAMVHKITGAVKTVKGIDIDPTLIKDHDLIISDAKT